MTRKVLLGMVQAYLAVVFLFAGGMKLCGLVVYGRWWREPLST